MPVGAKALPSKTLAAIFIIISPLFSKLHYGLDQQCCAQHKPPQNAHGHLKAKLRYINFAVCLSPNRQQNHGHALSSPNFRLLTWTAPYYTCYVCGSAVGAISAGEGQFEHNK